MSQMLCRVLGKSDDVVLRKVTADDKVVVTLESSEASKLFVNSLSKIS